MTRSRLSRQEVCPHSYAEDVAPDMPEPVTGRALGAAGRDPEAGQQPDRMWVKPFSWGKKRCDGDTGSAEGGFGQDSRHLVRKSDSPFGARPEGIPPEGYGFGTRPERFTPSGRPAAGLGLGGHNTEGRRAQG